MKYDFRNSPKINDKFHSEFIITEEDIIDDIGDAILVRHPDCNDEFRFYYSIEDNLKIIDADGIIQL